MRLKEGNCEGCGEMAIIYCQDCSIDYCQQCNEAIHKPRLFSTHIRIPLSQKSPPVPSQPSCPIHSDEKLKLFCLNESCRVLVCFMCSVYGSHKGHNCQLFQDVISGERIKLSQSMNQCAEEVTKLQSLSDSLIQCDATLQRKEGIYLQQLHQDVELAIEALRQKEAEIRDGVRREVKEMRDEIEVDLVSTNQIRTTASNYHQQAEEILSQSNHAELLPEVVKTQHQLETAIHQAQNRLESQKNRNLEDNSLIYLPSPSDSVRKGGTGTVAIGPLETVVTEAITQLNFSTRLKVFSNDLVVSLSLFNLSFSLPIRGQRN